MRHLIPIILLAISLLFGGSLFAQETPSKTAAQLNIDYFSEKETDLSENFFRLKKEVSSLGELYSDDAGRDGAGVINSTLLEGAAGVRYLHLSGEVIFNCEAGSYLNNLKDRLLKDFPFFKEEIRVFVTSSASFNAFAAVNNAIYVNVGTLALVENEAQLAFILSHEIMHIVNHHIIGQNLKLSGVKTDYNEYDIVKNLETDLLRFHAISQADEFEADMDGLNLYSLAGYPLREVPKAIMLLKQADKTPINVAVNSALYFVEKEGLVEDYLADFTRFQADSRYTSGETRVTTHPSIDQRYKVIADRLTSTASDTVSGTVFQLFDQSKYNSLKAAAKAKAMDCLILEGRFTDLFLVSSADLQKGDVSDITIRRICYAVQGIVHERRNGDADDVPNVSDDQYTYVLKSIFRHLTKNEVQNWGQHVMNNLVKRFPESPSAKEFQDSFRRNVERTTPVSGSLSEVPFEIKTNGVNLTGKERRRFNQTKKSKEITGRLGVGAIFSMSLSRKPGLKPIYHAEKLDNQVAEVFSMLEESRDNSITSFIPDGEIYSSKDYLVYQQLNKWLLERVAFDGAIYTPFEGDSVIRAAGIDYIFTGINIEVKGFNGGRFLVTWFGAIPFPIYIPQMIVKTVTYDKRKFMLSLVIDVKSGEIVFWDKRTYLEPNSTAQLFQNYSNVLNRMSENEK